MQVHGVAAMHKVLAHGGRCQIRRIHDMEAHNPSEIHLNVPYSTVKYLAMYVREKLNNVPPKSVLIVLIFLV